MQQDKSLSQFVSEKRENLGLSQSGLAKKSGLSLSVIEDIESGKELFLPVTYRQKLAKGLKVGLPDIKQYEKTIYTNFEQSAEFIMDIKQKILDGDIEGLKCPICSSPMQSRLVRMYDIEDNLIYHPKANCIKCPFQIK